MKLKNSPGRKNQRRIEAVERMIGYISCLMASDDTQAKIVDPVTARNTRTKKHRHATPRL